MRSCSTWTGQLAITTLAVVAFSVGSANAQASKPFISGDVAPGRAMLTISGDDMPVLRSRFAEIDAAQLLTRAQSADAPAALRLKLFDDTEHLVYLTRVESGAHGSAAWKGYVAGERESQVLLAEADGALAGTITTPTASYYIRFVSHGVYEIGQVDREAFKDEAEPIVVNVPASSNTQSSRALGGASSIDDGSVIDLLVVYTTAAKSGAGSESAMSSLIALGVSESNQALDASGVATRFRLAGTMEWNHTESGISATELSAVRTSSEVAAIRDARRADIVLLLTNRLSDTCGGSYLMNTMSEAFAAYAFAVVDRNCVSPNYSFVHELGHVMGSDHAPEDGGRGGLFPYAVAYKDAAASVRTVMALDCPNNCRRVLMFSSPRAGLNGRPAGDNAQDNARAISEAARIVAKFRASSSSTAVTPVQDTLPSPSGLTATVLGSTVSLKWRAPAGVVATSYMLEAGSASGLANVARWSISGGTTSAQVPSMPAGEYYWRIRAVTASGASAPSNEISVRIAQ